MTSTFVDSWKTPAVDVNPEKCIMDEKSSGIMELECTEEIKTKALQVCEKLIKNSKFGNCLKVIEFSLCKV